MGRAEKPNAAWVWVVGFGLILAVVWAVQQLHFIVKVGNPEESAPPAIAVLFALGAAGAAWLVRRRFPISSATLYLWYILLIVAAPIAGIGFFQRFIILITILPYRATDSNGMLPMREFVPRWYCPGSEAAITGLFEGGTDRVPWSAWLVPITFWTVFMTALFCVFLAVVVLLRRQWIERERLVFPLAVLPAQLVSGMGGRPVFRQRLFWAGFAVAFGYQLACGINHYLGLVPEWDHVLAPFGGVVERPWRMLNQPPAISLRLSLTVLGLGYLVNQEISFSIWFFQLLIKVGQLVMDSSGLSLPGFPHLGAQALGAFFTFGALCLWLARRHLGSAVSRALGWTQENIDEDEPMRYRSVLLLLATSLAIVLGFLTAAGMPVVLTIGLILYFVLMAVTYARIRAECGAPIIWCLPLAGITFMGSAMGLTGSLFAEPRTVTLLALLGFLTIGFFPALAATQMESLKLAELVGIPRRVVPAALVLACAVGIVASFAFVLPLFYRYGANTLATFETSIMWWNLLVAKDTLSNARFDVGLAIWSSVGGVITAILVVARFVFLRFPLHPLGYVIALTYGGNWMLGCLFLAWLTKTLVLAYGGVRLFRTLAPLFLALPLGEFCGIGFWYLVAPLIGGEAYLIAWG